MAPGLKVASCEPVVSVVELGDGRLDAQLLEAVEVVAAVGADRTHDDRVAAQKLQSVGDVGRAPAVVAGHALGDEGEVDVIETVGDQVVAEAAVVGKNVVVGNRAADHDCHG